MKTIKVVADLTVNFKSFFFAGLPADLFSLNFI
jgi:hypothetical protein